jgi:uncharacterized protein
MKIAISGAGGFLGSALRQGLQERNMQIITLVRRRQLEDAGHLYWSPKNNVKPDLPPVDVLINLSGENLFGVWTSRKKQQIYSSRISSTRLLADTVSRMPVPPALFINASAIGYYGDQGDRMIDESYPRGNDFLAKTCADWEKQATALKTICQRVVFLRSGVVLSQNGGFLQKMLPLFKWGLGAKIGSGDQYLSWIHLQDWVAAVIYIIKHHSLSDAVNLVAPQAVTNAHLTKALAGAVHRPALFHLPGSVFGLLTGEMGKTMVLSGTRCVPEKLHVAGFEFHYKRIENALADCVRQD